METNPISAVEAVVFVVLMLVILKIAVDALEAAPLGFDSQADDYIEDAADAAGGVWEDYT